MLRFAKFSSDVTDLHDDIYVNPNLVLAVNTFPNPDVCELVLADNLNAPSGNRIHVNMSVKEVLTRLQITSDPDIDN